MSNKNQNGRIEVSESDDLFCRRQNGSTLAVAKTRVNWFPPPLIADHLPVGFHIGLDQTTLDGIRRFMPDEFGVGGLLANSFLTGTGLRLQEKCDDHQEQWTLVRRFCSQWIRHRNDYLARRFNCELDLIVSPNGRIENSETSILAPLKSLHSALHSVKKVMQFGKDDDSDSLGPVNIIEFNSQLYEIAKVVELQLNEQKCAEIIRDSLLYHEDELPNIDDEMLRRVESRVSRAIQRHLQDTQENFDKWFMSRRSNLVTTIARGSKKHGESPLNTNLVKAAIFELGWQGIREGALNLEATMEAIATNLRPFTGAEDEIFRSVYVGSPILCGFPLLTLWERSDFLRSPVLEIWNGAQLDAVFTSIPILLFMYSQMVRVRRSADKLRFRRNDRKDKAMPAPVHIELNEQLTEGKTSSKLQSRLIELLELCCDSCRSSNIYLAIEMQDDDSALIGHQCDDCGYESDPKLRKISDLREQLKKDDD